VRVGTLNRHRVCESSLGPSAFLYEDPLQLKRYNGGLSGVGCHRGQRECAKTSVSRRGDVPCSGTRTSEEESLK
jgi:hypothetical protein